MNSKNSKTFDFHTPLHNLSDTIDLKRTDKYVLLRNLSIYLLCMGKCNIKNNKLKISDPTWNRMFELPYRSFSVSDIRYSRLF